MASNSKTDILESRRGVLDSKSLWESRGGVLRIEKRSRRIPKAAPLESEGGILDSQQNKKVIQEVGFPLKMAFVFVGHRPATTFELFVHVVCAYVCNKAVSILAPCLKPVWGHSSSSDHPNPGRGGQKRPKPAITSQKSISQPAGCRPTRISQTQPQLAAEPIRAREAAASSQKSIRAAARAIPIWLLKRVGGLRGSPWRMAKCA